MSGRDHLRPGAGTITPALLARAVQARQLRTTMSAFLPRDLFVDPAWDMMIELFIAAATAERLCVKDLMLLSGESAAGTIRRIDRLQAAGLLTRTPCPDDHRRVCVDLTDRGRTSMAGMLEHLFDTSSGDDARAQPRSYTPGTGWK